MKRGRNQRRRQGGPNPNRALDSNGPDVRIRGTANQIYDKYVALARDASSAGDRIKAESYLQHAEHYFRVIRAMQPAQPQPQPQPADGEQPSVDEASAGNASDAKGDAPKEEPANSNDDAKVADEKPAPEASASNADGDVEEKPKRRRGRRPTKRATKKDDAPAEEPAPAAAE